MVSPFAEVGPEHDILVATSESLDNLGTCDLVCEESLPVHVDLPPEEEELLLVVV